MDKIIISGKEYNVKAGYGSIILFCERKNIELYQFIDLFTDINPDKLSTELFKGMAEFTLCMIERSGCKDLPDVYEVIDWFTEIDNMVKIQSIMFGLVSKNAQATGEKE